MKKKIIVIISIIALLVFIPLAIIGGIKYRNYIAEIEAVELPEIVFRRVVYNPSNGNSLTRMIDKEGNILFHKGRISDDELFRLYHEGKLQEECTVVNSVNVFKLKKKYRIFSEVVMNPDYSACEPTYICESLDPKYVWLGYYYDSNCEMQYKIIYGFYTVGYEVSDKRGKELADWITETLYD